MAVYLIQAADSCAVKIGSAHNPGARLEKLQVGHHELLVLIRVIDGGADEERWLHKRFQAQHIRGEWFRFTAEMMTIRPPDIVRWSKPQPQEVRFKSHRAWIANADKLGLIPDARSREFYGLPPTAAPETEAAELRRAG